MLYGLLRQIGKLAPTIELPLIREKKTMHHHTRLPHPHPTRSPHRLRPLALALFAALPLLAQAQSGIDELGTLGGTYSAAQGVSSDGAVVVGGSSTSDASRAFRWTQAGGMVDLGTLGGTSSWAYGVSADGAVVVGRSSTSDYWHAFRWTQSGGMVDLGTLGGVVSEAYGASADGAVVVGDALITAGVAQRAFRWTQAGGMVDLGTLGGTSSSAFGVSDDGAVVVGLSETTGDAALHAFRWTQAGGMVDLGTLGGTHSQAMDVSADGSVVVGLSGHAFRWTQAGGMADLGTLGGTGSAAWGVSADGSVVVGESDTTGDAALRAFRWTQSSGMQSVEDWLRAAGVPVSTDITEYAAATNGDGSVVVGLLENDHAFIARVANVGSGLVTLDDLQTSLDVTAVGGCCQHGAERRPQPPTLAPRGEWTKCLLAGR